MATSHQSSRVVRVGPRVVLGSSHGLIALVLMIGTIAPLKSAEASDVAHEISRMTAACRSNDPVMVIDTFPALDASGEVNSDFDESALLLNPRGRIVDIDGDGTPDLYHGELVDALVKAGGHSTKRVSLDGNVSLPDLALFLEPIVQDIETGRTKISRINFSQENPLKLTAFKKDLFQDDPSFPEITARNIREYAPRILERLWTEREDLGIKELRDLFARLEKAGVPVVVAGGNFSPTHVNLFSMLPGVITVGSLDHKNRKLLTSADNDYVRFWKLGVVVPEEVAGGMDITGDEKPEFDSRQLSGGKPIVSDLNGKNVTSLLKRVSTDFLDWITRAARQTELVPNAAVNVIDQGLYDVEDLVALPTLTRGTIALYRSLGTYALKRKDEPPRFFFNIQADATLVFDPKGSGSLKQRNRIPGTSFAAPLICKN